MYFYLKYPFNTFTSFLFTLVVLSSMIFPFFYSNSKPRVSDFAFEEDFFIIIILMLGVNFLIKQFHEEKKKRNIELLMALGFSPIKIWLCKMITIWIITYSFYLIGILFLLIIPKFIFPSEILCDKNLIFYFNLFLFLTFIPFSILGLVGVLYLIFEDIRAINILIILFFPFLIFLLFIFKKFFFFYSFLIRIIFTIFFLSLSFIILKLVPKERYL